MNPTEAPKRCRLVLIAPRGADPRRILSALDGGDIASIILPQWDNDDDSFQSHVEAILPEAQQAGLAVMVAGDPRIASRCRADGIHFEGSKDTLADIIEKHQSKMMIGTGGATTRDDALELGELQPDYMFFGKFGYDNKPEPHARNLKLGQWWAEMVQVPAIVMAGSELAGLASVAETGVDFVALSAAVYDRDGDPAEAVARANAILDEDAPRIDEG